MRISDWSSDVCSSDLGRDDRILACAPVSRRGDTVLISELKRIDGAKNFIEIPAHAHGIGHGETDLLIRIDNEDRTDRRSLALVRVDHVVEFGDLEISVRYDWKDQIGILRIVNILDPLCMLTGRENGRASGRERVCKK